MERAARAGSIRRLGYTLLAALSCTFLLLVSPLDRAEANVVDHGRTHLTLSRDLYSRLQSEGVEVRAAQSAKAKGRVLTLPVSGGQIDPGNAVGAIAHDGGLKLKLGGRTVTLRDLTLDTAKGSVRAKVDGRAMRLASVQRLSFSRDGFGDEIEVRALKLSAGIAGVLNGRLHLHGVFKPGLPLATLSSTVQPEWDDVSSGNLLLSLDEGFVAKLNSLGLEPSPFEAQVVGSNPPAYSSRLINGSIYPPLNNGGAGVESGLRVFQETPPGPVLSWVGMGLNFESNRLFATVSVHSATGEAKFDSGTIAVLNMAGATVKVDPVARTVAITNLRATLEAHAAEVLNETFAQPKGRGAVFAAGDPLGTFAVTMQGR